MARPSKRTPEVETAILTAIEIGASRADAAAAVGVGWSTMASWTRRNATFRAAVEKAEAAARIRMVGIVAQAATRTWTAAAWYLERSDPQHWGRRDRVDVAFDARREAERLASDLGGVSADELVAEAERIASHRG